MMTVQERIAEIRMLIDEHVDECLHNEEYRNADHSDILDLKDELRNLEAGGPLDPAYLK